MTAGWQGGSSTTGVTLPTCTHCGGIHTSVCTRVKAIEYYPDGKIKRVEYVDQRPNFGPTTTVTHQITPAPIVERGDGLRARLARGGRSSDRLR